MMAPIIETPTLLSFGSCEERYDFRPFDPREECCLAHPPLEGVGDNLKAKPIGRSVLMPVA
jgi:hypothetical protein